jgi:transcriptional regulator with XRE-family HTH domain
MQFKESFGGYLRKLREGKNLPIRKVAAYCDIDPSTLSKIERDERSANKDMINILRNKLILFLISGIWAVNINLVHGFTV